MDIKNFKVWICLKFWKQGLRKFKVHNVKMIYEYYVSKLQFYVILLTKPLDDLCKFNVIFCTFKILIWKIIFNLQIWWKKDVSAPYGTIWQKGSIVSVTFKKGSILFTLLTWIVCKYSRKVNCVLSEIGFYDLYI